MFAHHILSAIFVLCVPQMASNNMVLQCAETHEIRLSDNRRTILSVLQILNLIYKITLKLVINEYVRFSFIYALSIFHALNFFSYESDENRCFETGHFPNE